MRRLIRVASVLALRIQQSQVIKRVVEHGIRNQATRVVWATITMYVQGGTVARPDIITALRAALELVNVDRPDVAAMVLVEVGEAIVEQDRRFDLFGDVEAQDADISLSDQARYWPGIVVPRMAPLRLGLHVLLESR
jgi:hypothetical protein